MNTTLLTILLVAGVALFIIFILREARRFAGFLLAFGVLAVVGVVAYALVAQAQATRQVARVAEVQAMTAGMTLTLFLFVAIICVLLMIGAAIAGLLWWKERRRRQRMLEFLWLNQCGAFTGSRSGASHSLPQGAPVIIVPTGYPPIPGGSGLYIPPEILTQLQEPNDPLAGLLPE